MSLLPPRLRDELLGTAAYIQLALSTHLIREAYLDADTIDKTGSEFGLLLKCVRMQIAILRDLLERNDRSMYILANKRLRNVLRKAQHSSWWHSYFERNVIDPSRITDLSHLVRIPPIDRNILLDVPKEEFFTYGIPNQSVLWGRTSGSTTGTPFIWGMPKKVWRLNILARHILDMEEDSFDFIHRAYDNFCLLFNYSGTPGHMQHFLLGNVHVAHDDPHADAKIRAMADLIETHGPVVIRSSPPELVFLAQKFNELSLHPPIGFCSVTGAQLDPDIYDYISRSLQCDIRPVFGIQELGGIGLGCRTNPDLFHIWSERIHIEILDTAGLPLAPGEFGKVTLTCLDSTHMPMLRYQTGDVGRLVPEHICTCKYTGPDVLELKDRMNEMVVRRDGSSIALDRIVWQFKKEPFVSSVRRFQVRQELPGTIEILLETKGLLSEVVENARKNIERAHMLSVTMRQVSYIPQESAKFKVFVSALR